MKPVQHPAGVAAVERRGGLQVRCMWDSALTNAGGPPFEPERMYSCRRLSLPGRLVCHKHAHTIKQVARRRRLRKANR